MEKPKYMYDLPKYYNGIINKFFLVWISPFGSSIYLKENSFFNVIVTKGYFVGVSNFLRDLKYI